MRETPCSPREAKGKHVATNPMGFDRALVTVGPARAKARQELQGLFWGSCDGVGGNGKLAM
jgi:hypothetical protein